MKQLIIGDYHFGAYNNNQSCMEAQIKLFDTQIANAIRQFKDDLDCVVFLGDLFDIRYSVHQIIGYEVKLLITRYADMYKHIQFIFIGGNHDYFTPLEDLNKYNVYNVVFGEEYCQVHKNVTFVWDKPYEFNNKLFVPWYHTENPDNFQKLIVSAPFKSSTVIYTHTDLEALDLNLDIPTEVRNKCIISGHIHTPFKKNNWFCAGSVLPLNFNDVNSSRYFYIFDDNNLVVKVKNSTTLQFKRYYDEEIFTLTEESFVNAKTQLCISADNINKARYIEMVKEIKSIYNDYKISVRVFKNDEITLLKQVDKNQTLNIKAFINDNIPDYLKEKYNIITDKLNEDKQDSDY